ncbi:MAG: response regulator [Verrucomicrobia bacterium]|nr:response regulator [Verrucomicrobiota bacterium]
MKSILLIDDDGSLHSLLAAPLKEADWTVLHANGGEEGIRAGAESKPDIIVCELLLPRVNGYQVCRSLQARRDGMPQCKIIVAGSSSDPADRSNALKAGADGYLVKPFRPADFFKLLGEIGASTTCFNAARAKAPAKADGGGAPVEFIESMVYLIGRPPTVRFWGVRGSLPMPGPSTLHYGGNTSCLEVRADGEIIILDAGTGIRQLGRKLTQEFKDTPIHVTLLISHTHWDHIQGFPFFIPAYSPKNKVRILGHDGATKGLSTVLARQMESPYFPISMQQMPSHLRVEEIKDLEFKVGAVTVKATFLNHPGICMGYRLETSGGSVCYLPDNEPNSRLRPSPGAGPGQSCENLSSAQEQDEKLIDFIRDADVLVMDSQYDATEYRTQAGWGHGCVDDVVALAVVANVRKLFLFHHDPDHDDAHVKRMADWAAELAVMHGATLEVQAAREGVEVVLAPKPA